MKAVEKMEIYMLVNSKKNLQKAPNNVVQYQQTQG